MGTSSHPARSLPNGGYELVDDTPAPPHGGLCSGPVRTPVSGPSQRRPSGPAPTPGAGSSLNQVGLVGLVPAWRVDGGKIVSLTA